MIETRIRTHVLNSRDRIRIHTASSIVYANTVLVTGNLVLCPDGRSGLARQPLCGNGEPAGDAMPLDELSDESRRLCLAHKLLNK